MTPRPVHIGCSGWNYADWRGAVYPEGCPPRRWLAHYATLFATVEVNSTFYRLARPEAVDRWVQETPPGFVFTVKSSWFCSEVYGLLHTFGVALVEGDDPRRPLPAPPLTADWAFIRLHFGRRGRRGNYSERELQAWAQRLRDLREEVEVFAYFNNDWEAFAVRNARRLRRLVEGPREG